MDVQGVSLFTIPFITTATNSMDGQGVSISTPSIVDLQGAPLSTSSSMYMQGVFLSTTSSKDLKGVFLSTTSSTLWACRVTPFDLHLHHQQCERAGLHCRRAGCTYVSLFTVDKVFINAGMPVCPASGQSGTGMNENPDDGRSPVPENGDPVRYRYAAVPD